MTRARECAAEFMSVDRPARPARSSKRLPALGPRGEGWFIGQLAFIVAIAVASPDAWPTTLVSVSRPLGGLLLVAGFLVAGRGLFDLGGNVTPFPRPKPGAVLVDRGVYGLMRHPIYAGLMLLGFGWSLWRASTCGLLLAVAFALFLDLKARREEDFLAEAFPAYQAYRHRTARFIPRLY